MTTILILEEDPDVAETVRIIAESKGFKTKNRYSLSGPLNQFKGFDLLVMDILNVSMSCEDFLAKLNKQGIKKPIIILSGIGLPDREETIISKYANATILQKTMIYEKLTNEIKQRLKILKDLSPEN